MNRRGFIKTIASGIAGFFGFAPAARPENKPTHDDLVRPANRLPDYSEPSGYTLYQIALLDPETRLYAEALQWQNQIDRGFCDDIEPRQ